MATPRSLVRMRSTLSGDGFSLNMDIDAATDALTPEDDLLMRIGEHIGQVSDSRCPIEYGDLIRSRRVTVDQGTVAVSYNTPYAVRQHEELDYQHDAGRQAKYLESAVADETGTVQRMVRDGMRL